jgi:hypothetical protein
MRLRHAFLLACALALPPATQACSVDSVPDGLRATPPGDGPQVMWDLTHRPLPAIPLPNDFATFADPTSRTGLRVNASILAPTAIEQATRVAVDELEGWGTYIPIAVRFQKDSATDPRDPAVDIADIKARMQGDDHDFSNDPVYVVNLVTGVPLMVDMGDGNLPVTLRDTNSYWPNDPHQNEQNLLFETLEEGPGLSQADYRPSLDLDFDGILDHPNTFGPAGQVPGVDDLLTWYDLQTDTLIVRPLLPMEEKTQYAVVLTDRLRATDGKQVRSPFPWVHHPSQRDTTAKLQSILSDPSRGAYYGDIAGSGLDHVTFTWTFTTMPIHEDMKLLHDGLYGKGPFGYVGPQYPPTLELQPLAGNAAASVGNAPGWQSDPTCTTRAKTPYAMQPNDPDVFSALDMLYRQIFGFDAGATGFLERGQKNIDYIVVGTFQTPYFEGDPADTDPEEARFHANFMTGQADLHTDTVHFWLTVPKATKTAKAPFPVMFWGHGVTGNDTETLIYAGEMARQGLATFGMDMPEHGLFLSATDYVEAQVALRPVCLLPLVDAVNTGRARDYDQDGQEASGWFWWTSHFFHVRDNVRQGTLDQMNAVRIMRSFDGVTRSDQDFNGDGTNDLAGDFNADGTPDVGGPDAPYYASGESLGGIMEEILGGVEPRVVAAAPMSGGGGLTDIGARSYGVTNAVWEQIFGPLIIAIPATARPPTTSNGVMTPQTACQSSQMSLRQFVNDGATSWEVEIACLNANELGPNMTVVARNITSGQQRCARTGSDGGVRIEMPSTLGDAWEVDVLGAPDAVDAYGTACHSTPGVAVVRTVNTFEVPATSFKSVADASDTCTGTSGCTQFRSTFYPVGSQLVAVNDGLGIKRQSPDVREMFRLAQMIADPADPINYAPYYMLRPLLDENGNNAGPHALLAISTVGDGFVDIETGQSFARAAGAVPFLPPQAITKMPEYADYVTAPKIYQDLGSITPNQYLIANHVTEGVARLQRTHANPGCKGNYLGTLTTLCNDAGRQVEDPTVCAEALYDPDWVSEGKQLYAQPHGVPLRMARLIDVRPSSGDPTSLDAVWAPREKGEPFTADTGAWSANARVLGMFDNYITPSGNHTWDVGDLCLSFDPATYGDGIIARFLASGGKDVYYLSHPTTHTCLAYVSCDFEQGQ